MGVTEVEQILDTRLFGWWKKRQYLIKWKGYAEAHNSWEPEENVNTLELVKEFHQQTGASIRLRVLKSGEKTREPTMTQPVDSTTPLPRPHSPRLLSPFSIDCHGDYPLPDMPQHKVAPLVQVTFLVTLYGTLTGQDAFLISQRKAWTSKQEWLRRHQKWRKGIW